MRRIEGTALWVLASAGLSLTGWLLSFLHALTPWGYGISLAFLFTALGIGRKYWLRSSGRVRWRLRFGRALPGLWLLSVVLTLLGGVLHPPNNFDYLTYRLPRILHWLAEGRWCWIPTGNDRMNYSGTGFEWWMTALLALFRTDRLFFLVNWFSFLLLPGLIFSVFSALGVGRRIAWWWMWVLPSGYCFLLQAGSVGNDTFAATYVLASVHYALRAGRTGRLCDWALACLAAALLTGTKASNLPLLLPCLIALVSSRRVAWHAPLRTCGIVCLALAVSFAPIAIANRLHTGSWFGDPEGKARMTASNPLAGITGNTLQLVTENLTPPLWPHPASWRGVFPDEDLNRLRQSFPRLTRQTGEMRVEESAGIGLGAVVACLGLIGMALRKRSRIKPTMLSKSIVVASFLSLLAYMALLASESTARLVAAYYPLLVVGFGLALPADGSQVRKWALQGLGICVFLGALPLLLLNPARPLFPPRLILEAMNQVGASLRSRERAEAVYRLYAGRTDALRDLRMAIPPEERVIGLLQEGNDPEGSLWLPFGKRTVHDVFPKTSRTDFDHLGIHFVAVSKAALDACSLPIDILANRWNAHVVLTREITVRLQRGPETWYLLRIDTPSPFSLLSCPLFWGYNPVSA